MIIFETISIVKHFIKKKMEKVITFSTGTVLPSSFLLLNLAFSDANDLNNNRTKYQVNCQFY